MQPVRLPNLLSCQDEHILGEKKAQMLFSILFYPLHFKEVQLDVHYGSKQYAI